MEGKVINEILSQVDEKRVIDLTRKLLMIPSVGFITKPVIEDTGECASFCAEYMERFGCDIVVQHDIGKQAIGILKGTGNGKNLMLNGHLDTSPIARGWTVEPYEGIIKGDKIYGPGANNMKGGVAAMIAAAEAVSKSGIKLKGDIVIAPVFGERAGGIGTKTLLRSGIRTDYAIVCEPNGDKIDIEHNGAIDGAIHVYGRMGMAPKGVNALGKMWELLSYMGLPGNNMVVEKPAWLRADPDAHQTSRLFVGALDAGIGSEYLHEPKGAADICTAYFDLRPTWLDMLPTEESAIADIEKVLEKFRSKDPQFRAELECPIHGASNGIPLKTPPDAEVVQKLAKWFEYVSRKKPSVITLRERTGSSYTDAGHLSKAGIISCVSGPTGGGSSNRPDEWNSISEIIKMTKIYALTIVDICG